MKTLKVLFKTRKLGQQNIIKHTELIDVEEDATWEEIDSYIKEEYNRLHIWGKDVEAYPYMIID